MLFACLYKLSTVINTVIWFLHCAEETRSDQSTLMMAVALVTLDYSVNKMCFTNRVALPWVYIVVWPWTIYAMKRFSKWYNGAQDDDKVYPRTRRDTPEQTHSLFSKPNNKSWSITYTDNSLKVNLLDLEICGTCSSNHTVLCLNLESGLHSFIVLLCNRHQAKMSPYHQRMAELVPYLHLSKHWSLHSRDINIQSREEEVKWDSRKRGSWFCIHLTVQQLQTCLILIGRLYNSWMLMWLCVNWTDG